MQARRVLIIGSQCDIRPRLEFISELAAELHDKLVTAGGWRPALASSGPTLDPTTAQLKEAVRTAFAAAKAERATLLIAFIGHGMATGNQDFYLLAVDSPADPSFDTGYHLTEGIRAELNRAPELDGLILLVDACDAGQAVVGAANRWVDVLQGISGRMELFVASGDGNAYDGCFTRTLVGGFEAGVETAGEFLLCADLEPAVTQCPGQTSQRLSFGGGGVAPGDPGLWLVPNRARSRDAVTGRPSAGLVDQLTRGVVITDMMREHLARLVTDQGSRLRVVAGLSGCGKSTLLALLIRPDLVTTLGITADYIAAAAFLDATTTLESLSLELAEQLGTRVNGFAASRDRIRAEMTARDQQLRTSFEREIVLPLRDCRAPGLRVRILIDGIDQPGPGGRDQILRAIADLTRDNLGELQHVHVLVGMRSDSGVEARPELDHAHRTFLDPPTQADLRHVLPAASSTLLEHMGPSGGWLLARLISETQAAAPAAHAWPAAVTLDTVVRARFDSALPRMSFPGAGVLLTSVLVAAGVGAVLPIELAASIIGSGSSLTFVRDMLVELGTLVSRGKPGTSEEMVGVAHSEFINILESAVVDHTKMVLRDADAEHSPTFAEAERFPRATHARILLALEELESTGKATPNIARYALNAAPRHHLAVGDGEGAIRAMLKMTTYRAADNRDRWAAWLPTFQEQLGPDHRATWIARNNHAYWRGEAGDVHGAVAELEELVPQHRQALGESNPDTFVTRNNLSRWRGEAGNVDEAIAELKVLLADRIRVLGERHPDTLVTRNQLAGWQGEAGAAAPAVIELESLVREMRHAVGDHHPNTLATRENLAARRAGAGDIRGAAGEYADLLSDRARIQGVSHPETLATCNDMAILRAESGDLRGAIANLQVVVDEQRRVLGEHDPRTLGARVNLAVLRAQAEAGAVGQAIAELDEVLREQHRLLSTDHLQTAITRRNLIFLRRAARQIDVEGAIAALEEVHVGHQRKRRTTHPEALIVRAQLAEWRGESGDVVTAVRDYEAVLGDLIQAMGPNHWRTIQVHQRLDHWRSRE